MMSVLFSFSVDWSLRPGLEAKKRTSSNQCLKVKNKEISLQVQMMYFDGLIFGHRGNQRVLFEIRGVRLEVGVL